MERKPIIGISTNLLKDKGGTFPGLERVYVNRGYVESVIRSGGIPLMIPFEEDLSVVKSQIELIDGLILSGGQDVFPFYYNEDPKAKIGEVMPSRDRFDFELLKNAKEKGIPILGICRGVQVINVYEGGTLYQDLDYIDGEVLKHSQNHDFDLETHIVYIEEDSKLYEIFNKKSLLINSFHHQSLKDIANGYKVTAKASDGVVEAIEHQKYPFLVGVQWHPEALTKHNDDMLALFERFISECRVKE